MDFRFASLQSDFGKKVLADLQIDTEENDSLILIDGMEYFLKSTAAFKILKELKTIWKLLYPLKYLPVSFRDKLYDLTARYRYRIFGKKEVCMVPNKEISSRFLV